MDARTGRWKGLTWAMTEEYAAKWLSNSGHCAVSRINRSQQEHTVLTAGTDVWD